MRTVARAKVFLVALLLLNTVPENKSEQENPTAINATNTSSCIELVTTYAQQCPTWFLPTIAENGAISCECGLGDNYDIKCDAYKNRTKLRTAHCITFDSSTNITYLGSCPYNKYVWNSSHTSSPMFTTLPENINDLNDFMCGGLNRTGLFCSQCQDGLGPAVLSNKMECLECLDSRYGWLVYLSLTMLPTTILCIIVIILRFDATSAPMNIFIIVCQILIAFNNYYIQIYDSKMEGKLLITMVLTFYGFWNLDFFRYLIPPFCISSRMTTMQVVALDYTVALYPLIFTAVIYYFIEFHDKGYRVCVSTWKPFRRCFIRCRKTWNLKGSVINAFATFLLLSFSKLITVSRNLIEGVQLNNICGENTDTGFLAFYDTSMKLFSRRHLVFAVPAILISLIFIILPTLLLLFYQNKYFQKFLGCLPLQLTLLHELVKNIHSCFKDGTGGTWDCRWFAGVYFVVRTFAFLIIGVKYYTLWLTCGLLVASTLFMLFQPYKNNKHNRMNTLIINIVVLCVVWSNFSWYIHYITLWPVKIAWMIPLVYFICLVIYKISIRTPAHKVIGHAFNKMVQKLKKQPEENEAPPYRLLHPEEYPPLLSSATNTYKGI